MTYRDEDLAQTIPDYPTRTPRAQTHLYPVGTVVRLKQFSLTDDSHLRDWTVTGLVRNGADSYVFKTGEFHTSEPMKNVERAFNLDHVACVVKRGTGPVVIDHSWYGINKKVVEAARQRFSNMTRHPKRKGWLLVFGYQEVVHQVMLKYAAPGAMINYSKACADLRRQTWVQEITTSGGFHFSYVNKKRLDKWARANRNRFLVPMTQALAAECAAHEEEAEQYYRDLDDEFMNRRNDDLNDEGPNEVPGCHEVNGSHYDHEDGYRRDELAWKDARRVLGLGLEGDETSEEFNLNDESERRLPSPDEDLLPPMPGEHSACDFQGDMK